MKKRQTSKHVNPFQQVAKMPGEAVMLKQVENIANIETSNETSKISCDLKEREQSMVQGWSTTDNLLESYEFGQVELKLAVATFMEEEPRFLDEEE